MADIDILAEATELETYWKYRNEQMLKDRDILNLVKPTPTTDVIKWVSNEPKVFYDTAKALISSYPARFRMPLSINFTPEEKDKMNKAERFILGIFRSLDRRQLSRGQAYWLRDLAHWILSGWYAVFTRVARDKEVEFIADLWDPITVYPEWDSNGLVKCIRSFEVDKKLAIAMVTDFHKRGLEFQFIEPRDTSHIKVVNYWLNDRGKVYNAILLNEEGEVPARVTDVKSLKLEKFDHIPIFVGAIGVPEVTSTDWQVRRGESIIAANRDMYSYENFMASLMATIMTETAYPNMVSKTLHGMPVTKDGLKGYGEEIPIKIGETIELLKHAATPSEANLLLSWVGQKKQKGAIPDIVYGGVPFELSGFAISQLMAAIRYKLSPYINTMQYVISAIGTEFLTQYKKGKMPKITLSTTNPRELRRGQFFVEEFSPDDVPESLYLEVTIPITSAMDKTQQIIFARQALQPPQLISRETLWEDVLDIQDSEQEYARILQDETLELPVVKQIGMIESLRERVATYRADGKNIQADALNRYIMLLEMQLGMRQGIPQVPGAPGIPPEGMPPEMGAQGMSPDMLRAGLGVSPPGLKRRPQTPEERARTKGGLVSPTGEALL